MAEDGTTPAKLADVLVLQWGISKDGTERVK